MASFQLVQRAKATRICEEDWEAMKSLIRTRYIFEDRELRDILPELHNLSFQPTKAQLEFQVKKWGFRKNLRPEIWRYVASVIRDRAAALKATVVILSGRRLPAEKVDYETKRNGLVTWTPVPAPPAPSSEIPIYLCTPRSSTTNLAVAPKWPENLPWVQFSQSHLHHILKSLRLIQPTRKPTKRAVAIELDGAAASSMSLSDLARRTTTMKSELEKTHWLPIVFQQMIGRSLEVVVKSESMAMQLFTKRSIDCIAAQFDLVIPETYLDENVQRAITLTSGPPSEVLAEMLRLMMFLVSNHLVLQTDCLHRGNDLEKYLDDARLIVCLSRLCGLAERQAIRNLVEMSRQSLTLTAVVDALFEAAVNSEALDIVSYLLDEDSRIHLDRKIARFCLKKLFSPECIVSGTPLALAITLGRLDPVKMLLDAGANIQQNLYEVGVLAFAVMEAPDDAYFELARLLYQRGADINFGVSTELGRVSHWAGLSCLQAAILRGNINLIELLVAAGADLNSRYSVPFHPWYKTRGFHSMAAFSLADVGCLAFAAAWVEWDEWDNWNEWDERDEREVWKANAVRASKSQSNALGLCKEILDKYGSRMDLSPLMLTDAMSLAAARGYTDVVQFLHRRLSAPINSLDGLKSLRPIYAAVRWEQVETCRLLLRLGASPNREGNLLRPPTWPRRSATTIPTPLHLAVAIGSREIASMLVQHGARIDETYNTCPTLDINGILRPWRLSESRGTAGVDESPLRLALKLGKWDTALLLLTLGATAAGLDLFIAAKNGQLESVGLILRNGVHPDDASENGLSAYEAAISNGHGPVVGCLSAAGATIRDTDWASIFRLSDLAQIKSCLPQQLAGNPKLIGRDTDNRSYLENALLTGSAHVIEFALSLDPLGYDSGSMCAATLMAVRGRLPNRDSVLSQLLHRRDRTADDTMVDAVLENTAVSLAAWHRRMDITALLLASRASSPFQHSAVIPIRRRDPKSHLSIDPERLLETRSRENYLTSFPVLQDAKDWHAPHHQNISPLLFAVQGQNEHDVGALLNAGFRADGYSLRAAIRHQLSSGLVERLVESCLDINAQCAVTSGDRIQETPLHVAISLGRQDIVEMLLKSGADINASRQTHVPPSPFNIGIILSPLEHAVVERQVPIVDLLLRQGANLDGSGPLRKRFWPTYATTPLQLAIRRGCIGIVQHLLALGADINAPRGTNPATAKLHTALETAACLGRLDITQLLLNSKPRTDGYHRLQYVHAAWIATHKGFGAVADLLRSLRDWTVDDWVIWNRGSEIDSKCLHPEEFPPGELFEVIAGRFEDTRYLAINWSGPVPHQSRIDEDIAARVLRGVAIRVLEHANGFAGEYHGDRTERELLDIVASAAMVAYTHWTLNPDMTAGKDLEENNGSSDDKESVSNEVDEAVEYGDGLEDGASDVFDSASEEDDWSYGSESFSLSEGSDETISRVVDHIVSQAIQELRASREAASPATGTPASPMVQTAEPVEYDMEFGEEDMFEIEGPDTLGEFGIMRETTQDPIVAVNTQSYDLYMSTSGENEEEVRREALRRDMMGEEEAPFMSMDWEL